MTFMIFFASSFVWNGYNSKTFYTRTSYIFFHKSVELRLCKRNRSVPPFVASHRTDCSCTVIWAWRILFLRMYGHWPINVSYLGGMPSSDSRLRTGSQTICQYGIYFCIYSAMLTNALDSNIHQYTE